VNVDHLTSGPKEFVDSEGVTRRMFVVMYADDGIVFSDSPECTKHISCAKAGVTMSPEKSRWLKLKGAWNVNCFKFLGLEYYPETGLVRAKTRKGATLELKTRELFLGWLLAERDNLLSVALSRQLNFVSSSPEELLNAGGAGEPVASGYEKLFRVLRAKLEFPTKFKLSELRNLIRSVVKGPIEFGSSEYLSTTVGQSEELSRRAAAGDAIVYSGSASNLNVRVPESLRDWVVQEYMLFTSYSGARGSVSSMLLKILRSKYSGYFLSRMYQNSWSCVASQDFKLKAADNSWCKLRWPEYSYRALSHLRGGESLAHEDLWYQIHNLGREIASTINELEVYIQELSENRNEKYEGLMKRVAQSKKSARQLVTMGGWGINKSQIKLNIWNASSFACDDLLRN